MDKLKCSRANVQSIFFMQEIQEKNKMIVEIYESIGFECEIREDMFKKETFAKIDVSCKCYHV